MLNAVKIHGLDLQYASADLRADFEAPLSLLSECGGRRGLGSQGGHLVWKTHRKQYFILFRVMGLLVAFPENMSEPPSC